MTEFWDRIQALNDERDALEAQYKASGVREDTAFENFIGPNAKLSPQEQANLILARSLGKYGTDNDTILARTGWDLSGEYPRMRTQGRFKPKADASILGTLAGAYEHPSLYTRYPQLANRLRSPALLPKAIGAQASYHPLFNVFDLDREEDPEVVAHEAQHAIDDIEGAGSSFDLGGLFGLLGQRDTYLESGSEKSARATETIDYQDWDETEEGRLFREAYVKALRGEK